MSGVSLKTRLRNLGTDIECELYCLRSMIEARVEVNKAEREMRKAEHDRRESGDNVNEQSDSVDNNVTTNPETEVKTDEQIKAEAEAPIEEAGAEKIEPEAAMQVPYAPQPKQDAVINLGFGVQMNLDAMSNAVTPSIIQTQEQTAPIQPNPVIPFQQQPGTNNPFLMHQPQPPQQQIVPPIQPPRHKVDQPQPDKPIVEKAQPDNVQVDLHNIQVPTNPPKPPREWPEVVADPLPQAPAAEPVESTPKFDNSVITSKLKYMKEIERVALATNHQIQMIPQAGLNGEPNGLISCVVWNEGQTKPNPYKGFTIDTGSIIDRRVKMFPAILQNGYENLQAYGVMVPKPKDGGKGNKNQFNEQLFMDLFTGGVQMLNERDGMYTADFRELNKIVAMITVPNQHMNGDTRKKIRDRLFNAKKSGVFDAALKVDPGSRFRFVDYNKKDNSFKLSNVGVPKMYGTMPVSTIPIEIEFGTDSCKINYPKNVG